VGSLVALLQVRAPVDTACVERMARAAPHRGESLATVELGRVVLGVTRGDGIGYSDVYADDELAVAFSGEFDNLREQAEETSCASAGPTSSSTSSTSPAKVLAEAFRRQQHRALARLRGPFTAAVTDGRTLWCFRDQLGFRPLFYRNADSVTLAATEVKQVVAGAGISCQPNIEALESVFYGWAGRSAESSILGVSRLPGGSFLEAQDGTVAVRRYWHPERLFETRRIDYEELEARFHELFERAVARCLRGNDAVALSGGVDSPAIAAYAAPLYRDEAGRRLSALSSVFPALPSVDESRYIRAVSEELGLELHTFQPEARATDGLREWVRLFDAPVEVVSLSESYEFLAVAKRLGFKNLLSGEIAELMFDARHHVANYLVGHGRWGAARAHLRARRASGASRRRLAFGMARIFVPTSIRAAHRRFRGVSRDMRLTWMEPRRLGNFLVDRKNAWRDTQLLALSGKSSGLEPNDYVQSKAGVSERRPFADIDLIEFFLSLPAETRYPDPLPKTLLRRLLRGRVPDIILDRRDKTVFDEFALAGMDYPALRRWLLEPGEYRMPGVNYENLAERLGQENLGIRDFIWVRDLAAIHVFLSRWTDRT
jgi:asparagine synthase (glutamine-hydrolysing)